MSENMSTDGSSWYASNGGSAVYQDVDTLPRESSTSGVQKHCHLAVNWLQQMANGS